MITLPKWNPAICQWNGAYFPHRGSTQASPGASDSRPENTILVRSANTRADRQQAADLAKNAYGRLGYDTKFISEEVDKPTRNTTLAFLFSQGENLLGTYSVRLDTPDGVMADKSYAAEIALLRAEGKSIIELGQFAIDKNLHPRLSRQVQGVMLNFLALLCEEFLDPVPALLIDIDAKQIQRPELVIEVNPHHAPIWKALGWDVIGVPRRCERVNAASVLLSESCADLAAYANQTKVQSGHAVAWKFVSRNFLPSAQLDEIRMNLRKALSYTYESSGSDNGFVNALDLTSLPYPQQLRIASAEVSDER